MLIARSNTDETTQTDSKQTYQAQLTHTIYTCLVSSSEKTPCETLARPSQESKPGGQAAQ